MTQEFSGRTYFLVNGNYEIESNGQAFLSTTLIFRGKWLWSLADSFMLRYSITNFRYYPSIYHESGTFKTEGYPLALGGSNNVVWQSQ